MTLAAATFTEISRPFSEVQALQQNALHPISRAVGEKSGRSDKALATKNAQAISERYEKARIELRENIDLLTRKAEIYIDWASDYLSRSGRETHKRRRRSAVTTGVARLRFRLFRQVQFSGVSETCMCRTTTRPARKSPTANIARSAEKRGVDDKTKPKDAFIRICAGLTTRRPKNRLVQRQASRPDDALLPEAAHNKLAAARQWAAGSDRDAAKESEIVRARRRSTPNLMIWPAGSARSAVWRCTRWSKFG